MAWLQGLPERVLKSLRLRMRDKKKGVRHAPDAPRLIWKIKSKKFFAAGLRASAAWYTLAKYTMKERGR